MRIFGLVVILAACVAPFLLISLARKRALEKAKRLPPRKVKTRVVIYKECDSRLPFALGYVPAGTEILVTDLPAVNGIEWIEVTLPGGQKGYAIGPDVRNHFA